MGLCGRAFQFPVLSGFLASLTRLQTPPTDNYQDHKSPRFNTPRAFCG